MNTKKPLVGWTTGAPGNAVADDLAALQEALTEQQNGGDPSLTFNIKYGPSFGVDIESGMPVPQVTGEKPIEWRTWSIAVGDDADVRRFARTYPKRYAALYVGLVLITWALKPKELMRVLAAAKLPRGVDEDTADAILGLIGIVFDKDDAEKEER